ncbi:MAG: histidine phosphatase family protein [Ruminococcus sp.]|nr:histidine phosphatase family protein [Ruminococcus sp.]MDE6784529.1 histidine phosphatase family protein [Ruminococcus sp.]
MLYIMRHGKTDWNVKRKLQGRTDIPLNNDGRIMAENAHKEYGGVHFDVCYCSPLSRARETAEIFLKDRNIPIITDERLLEMSFGIYEGIENSFQIPDCPINVLFKEPEKYITPVQNAESFDELFARTGEFIREVVEPQLEQGRDILIVGHGAMNSSIVCQFKGITLDKFWSAGSENCKLMQLK